MAPSKCAYFRCPNTAETKSMFSFPWKDARRLKVWLDNCGNMTITHLPPESLKSKLLCIDHFETKYIQKGTGRRKTLFKSAVPIPFQQFPENLEAPSSSSAGSPDLKVLTPKRVYSNKRTLTPEDEDVEMKLVYNTPKRKKIDDTPKCKKLKSLLFSTKKKLNFELRKNKKMKNTISNKTNINLDKHKFSGESSKLLAMMQFRTNKKPWTDDEKKFCMSLYYKSPAAYKFMIQSKIVLAAPSTIQRWLQETNCLPGINKEIFENIKNKFYHKSIKNRACTVCFDEMSIMVDLEYTNKYDLIEGFEDFGGGDRNNREAKYALVFIARGIYTKWKIPLAYFLSSKTVDSSKLKVIVEWVINKLFESGLLPKVIVCDQATSNVKLIKELGATIDYPFFHINGRKIYSIFDVPHLIKNVRNNLLNNDFELDGNYISFKDIINIYNIDKNNKSKCLKKITPTHLNPNNFQKMKVKLATQVFSNAVAAAIKTAIDSKELMSNTAKHTADFVQLCNDLFDCLNSKNKLDPNPFRCAITNNQNTVVNQTLIKGKEVFSKLQKIIYNQKNNQKRLTRPPCFDGMIHTINAIRQLCHEEFTEGLRFMITYRLNQDVIENLFGIYRIKGGCNRNPTSKSLRSIFRSNLLNNLMNFDKTNCESDQEVFVTTHQNTQCFDPKPSTSSVLPEQLEIEGDVGGSESGRSSSQIMVNVAGTFEEQATLENSNITIETCSVVYFAGWLGKCCIDKFDCLNCKNILLKNQVDLADKKQLLLINRSYSNVITPTLKAPSEYLIDLVSKMLDFYNQNVDELYKINLVSNLIQKFKNHIHFSDDYHDFNHLDFLMKKLFEVKINDYCKSRKKSTPSAPKLRILQNK